MTLVTAARLAATALAAVAAVPAAADTVTLTFDSPVRSIAASGGTLDFYATVFAPASNSGVEYLNGDASNINPSNAFAYDDDGFLYDFPLSLAPGESHHELFFTLTVPAGTIPRAYTGSVALIGGATDSSQDRLGSATFQVNVTAVPEPATWAAMVLGLGIAGASLRRRSGRRPVSAR